MNLQPNTKKLVSNINYNTNSIEEIIHFFLNLGKNNLAYSEYSLYNNKVLILKDVNHSNNLGENIFLEQDIFFLKLAKLGLVDIELYDIHINIDTKEGEEAYNFMHKYLIEGGEYNNSDTGITKYDINKILKNEKEYNTFIKHIFSNILKNDYIDENFDIMDSFENLITMRVKINNMQDFFKGINNIFIKESKSTKEYLKNKLIEEYNSENNFIEFKLSNYFKNYTYIFLLLKHLNDEGKLTIKDIVIYTKFKGDRGTNYIKFKLEKHIKKILPIFLDDINIKKKNQYRTEYKKGGFYIDGELFKPNKNNKISNILKILCRYRDYSNKSEFSYTELMEYFKKNEKEYIALYNKVNENNRYENTKKLSPGEVDKLLLRTIFNKEYFKGSLGGRNIKKDIFICKKYNTGILI